MSSPTTSKRSKPPVSKRSKAGGNRRNHRRPADEPSHPNPHQVGAGQVWGRADGTGASLHVSVVNTACALVAGHWRLPDGSVRPAQVQLDRFDTLVRRDTTVTTEAA